MGLEDEETDCHRGISLFEKLMIAAEELREGDKVAEGLSHLLAIDGDHVVVDPVADAAGASGCLVLSDLALMVGEHQIHPAAVDVKLVPEVFLSHNGALEVPSRETFSPRGRPAHNVLRLSFLP